MINNIKISKNNKNRLTNDEKGCMLKTAKENLGRKGNHMMKWNFNHSLSLSIWCTRLAMAFVVLCAVMSSHIVAWYIQAAGRSPQLQRPILLALLISVIPAMGALFLLYRLLLNIRAERVFVDENVTLLRRISWFCFLAAIIMLASARFYLVFLLVGVACAFMGLILRVVKNVFQQAVILKSENELTI